jgi:hypothetical protein
LCLRHRSKGGEKTDPISPRIYLYEREVNCKRAKAW